jgi:carboxypeptidase family protein
VCRSRIPGWLVVFFLLVSPAAAQPPTGTLRIVVQDQSRAVIPGALVQVRGAEPATSQVMRQDLASNGVGVAVATDLPPGRYLVEVRFPGFETRVVPDVRVRGGDNKREVVLAIQKLDERVSVGRDPAISASDPKNDRFGTVLSKDQIDALPDDPDEMEKILKEMAGPGASIRVDGFRGGKLPPKSQIRSIRFSRDMFAAENHGGGMIFVDIATQPGLGPLRGSLDFTFRDDALNARNAFVQSKGAEQTQQYTLNMSGTLWKERTSFSLSAGGASLYDSANIFAAVPGGSSAAPVRRPSDRLNFNGRVDHSLTKAHTLRGTYQQSANDQRNLGVGNFDLAERAYARRSDDGLLRLSESGPWGKTLFGESRLQVHWTATQAASGTELPTIRVLDAFTSGGAQQAGGRDSTEIEWATNVDWARGRHAVRAGALVEGGWYRSDSRANYLGTYTFASLADLEAGRPATYTRRIGDPLVDYSQWQAGVYVQDDWRARKNLTLSAGVRQEVQTHLDDRWNLSPRASFSWSPFKSGKTTVRGGGGVFHDWLDAETFEQTLRVDGFRQQDLVIRNPGYPDPFAGGASQQVLPTSKYLLSPDLVMPRRAMINVGVSQQLTPMVGVNAGFTHAEGYNRFRGRNINAPLGNGTRPDPTLGNVTEVQSAASMRNDSVNVGFNVNVPSRRTFMFMNYSWLRQRNDADGPFSLPADSYDLSGEWGPAAGVPHHVFSGMINTTMMRNIRVGLSATARGGSPYNVITGRDDNGDTVINDRPAGVGRNSVMGRGMWEVAARLSYAFGFGERQAQGGMGPTMIVQRVGGGAGDLLGAMGGGGAENKRVRFEIFASAQNLFNTVNPVGFSGVMTSPFFGRPTGAMPGRRIDMGVRVGF